MPNLSADSTRLVHPLFQEEGGGSTPTSALSLTVYPIEFARAKALNRLWHSRLPRLGSKQARLCYAAEFDGVIYAVAIWSRPIARFLPQTDWLELQRFAIAPDAPRNTASRVLAVMTRLIRKKLPAITLLISYQDTEVHTGTIYRAAGWVPGASSGGGEWACPSRPRLSLQSTAPKRRWEKVIR